MMNGCPRWSFLTVPLLAALGCSDPVPRPARANVKLSVQKPVAGTGNCPVPGKTYDVGNPKPPTLPPPPPGSPGDRLTDGEHGASIQCSVKGSGPFTFSGNIKATSGEGDPVTIGVSGSVNADKVSGTAKISVFTKELGGSFSSAADGCTVTVVNGNVKAGSVWASISCPSITNPSTAQECSVGPVDRTISNFVFEDCDAG